MIRNQRNKRYTDRSLLIRLVVMLITLFGTSAVVIYSFSAMLVNRFDENERETFFSSIESGPLQLARLNSADLSFMYLNRLAAEANHHNPAIVGAKILSGPHGRDVYANWQLADKAPSGCLSTFSRKTTFPDGMYPYQVLLTVDRCATRAPLKTIKLVCILLGLLLVIATIIVCTLTVLPVLSSLRKIGITLDRNVSDSGSAADIESISYTPLRELAEKVLESHRLVHQAAIGRTTQMLAHDVRKPFSIFRVGMTMLRNAKDQASTMGVISKLVPEIDRAVGKAEGLIADIMDVGSTTTELDLEPVSPETLIEMALGDVFRLYPEANIAITYDLRHAHKVNVNIAKVGRVFSNILSNAVQAMKLKGGIWFKTYAAGDFVEFCLGNSGSSIPEEDTPKLFDAFFTSGKKGGTGLGLAITEKAVRAHGGKIWCESKKTQQHPDGIVEFHFTLPKDAAKLGKETYHLPTHSSEITLDFLNFKSSISPPSLHEEGNAAEGNIVQSIKALGRPLRVLFVDDESIYRDALGLLLCDGYELKQVVDFSAVSTADGALDLAANELFDLIITDIDLGQGSMNGFELIRELRSNGHSSELICVHSNRINEAAHRTAIEAGADAFLPKPMTRVHLLKLLLLATLQTPKEPTRRAGRPNTSTKYRPEILVVDDNQFILEAWETALDPDACVHVAANIAEVDKIFAADPLLIFRLATVITDLKFDNSDHDGIDIAKKIKAIRSDLPVFLSSDAEPESNRFSAFINRTIAKEPVSYARLVNGESLHH